MKILNKKNKIEYQVIIMFQEIQDKLKCLKVFILKIMFNLSSIKINKKQPMILFKLINFIIITIWMIVKTNKNK